MSSPWSRLSCAMRLAPNFVSNDLASGDFESSEAVVGFGNEVNTAFCVAPPGFTVATSAAARSLINDFGAGTNEGNSSTAPESPAPGALAVAADVFCATVAVSTRGFTCAGAGWVVVGVLAATVAVLTGVVAGVFAAVVVVGCGLLLCAGTPVELAAAVTDLATSTGASGSWIDALRGNARAAAI